MFEFRDVDGERITVRSARTLVNLLSDGRIGRETPVKRSGEPDYIAAGEHPEFIRIAETVGLAWTPDTPPQPDREPQPQPQPLKQAGLQSSWLPQVNVSPSSTVPAPAPVPPEPGGKEGVVAPAQARAMEIRTLMASTHSARAPRRGAQPRWDQARAVAGWLLVMVVASAIAGSLPANPLFGWLVGLAVQAVFSRQAARQLGRRFPGMQDKVVGAVCVGFGVVCAVFGGTRSIPLTFPLCVLLFMSHRLLGRNKE